MVYYYGRLYVDEKYKEELKEELMKEFPWDEEEDGCGCSDGGEGEIDLDDVTAKDMFSVMGKICVELAGKGIAVNGTVMDDSGDERIEITDGKPEILGRISGALRDAEDGMLFDELERRGYQIAALKFGKSHESCI